MANLKSPWLTLALALTLVFSAQANSKFHALKEIEAPANVQTLFKSGKKPDEAFLKKSGHWFCDREGEKVAAALGSEEKIRNLLANSNPSFSFQPDGKMLAVEGEHISAEGAKISSSFGALTNLDAEPELSKLKYKPYFALRQNGERLYEENIRGLVADVPTGTAQSSLIISAAKQETLVECISESEIMNKLKAYSCGDEDQKAVLVEAAELRALKEKEFRDTLRGKKIEKTFRPKLDKFVDSKCYLEQST